MTQEQINEMNKRFDEKFYEGNSNSVHCKEHKVYATPSEIKSFIQSEVERREKEIEKNIVLICARHSTWKPTEGYQSEEEKGFQKGLQSEGRLFASEVLSIISNKSDK